MIAKRLNRSFFLADLCYCGNSDRNILDSPSQRNLGFSVFKNFAVADLGVAGCAACRRDPQLTF